MLRSLIYFQVEATQLCLCYAIFATPCLFGWADCRQFVADDRSSQLPFGVASTLSCGDRCIFVFYLCLSRTFLQHPTFLDGPTDASLLQFTGVSLYGKFTSCDVVFYNSLVEFATACRLVLLHLIFFWLRVTCFRVEHVALPYLMSSCSNAGICNTLPFLDGPTVVSLLQLSSVFFSFSVTTPLWSL